VNAEEGQGHQEPGDEHQAGVRGEVADEVGEHPRGGRQRELGVRLAKGLEKRKDNDKERKI